MTDILTTRDLRYQYSEHEHVRLAEDLAHEITVCAEAERLFGVAKAAHKEAVERMQSTIRDLSRKLADGWEIRDVPCRLLPNDPEAGKRTIVRVDTGEVIAVEDMYTGQVVEEQPADKLFEIAPQVSADSQMVSEHASNGKLVPDNATTGESAGKTQPASAESSTEERTRTRRAKKVKMQGQDAILPDVRPKPDDSSQPGVRP